MNLDIFNFNPFEPTYSNIEEAIDQSVAEDGFINIDWRKIFDWAYVLF